MKNVLCLFLAMLLLCTLVACGDPQASASGSDLTPAEHEAGFPASGSNAQPVQDLSALLLANGGRWRSEQQTLIDPGVIVRELVLSEDGSFTYREGDANSEFSWFSAGAWTLHGEFLDFLFTETGEDFAPLPDADTVSAHYAVVYQDGSLSLRQSSDASFCNGEPGMTVYYYQEP